jgi:hypothetical protein
MRSAIRWRSVKIGATGAALLAVAAGIGYAAIPTNGLINGCYAKTNGGLRVIDPSAGQTCSPQKETALQWSQAGPKGDRGPSDAYSDDSGLNPLNFSSANGVGVDVATLNLSAGSYVFNAKVMVGNRPAGENAEVTCTLRYGFAVVFDISSVRLGGGAPDAAGSMATLATSGTRTLDAPQTVRLNCNTTSADAFAQYGQLNAVAVATLTAQ